METPCHGDPFNRSHTDKTILLLKIGERFVPIAEQAVLILPDDRSKKSSKDESVSEKNKDMPRSQSDSEEPVWTKVDLGSVDSSKSLAGIPSISEKEETEMVDMVELRASTLDREDKEASAQTLKEGDTSGQEGDDPDGEYATMAIVTNVSNARVLIDGHPLLDRTGRSPRSKPLEVTGLALGRTYEVKVERHGYETARTKVTVAQIRRAGHLLALLDT